ncbi:LptF/LptG family permease [Candidatus Pelagibacter sp. HIMB1542]|uniref:LptF/LptG family permease n=1 Tax=Candidatus Pelagibacter sp. HIMB1542 TaxID=3413346 RepID=UPI003F842DFD
MKVYIKFISIIFFKSLIYVLFIMSCLVFLLNLLNELEFFKNKSVEIVYPLFLSMLNTPSHLFELFPFVLLITVQLFFIKLFENREIDIFKYSGLKNSKIIIILSVLSLSTGFLAVSLFYNISSGLKNLYIEIKSPYTSDNEYLAVITKNGLWIKDKIKNNIMITNSSYIENQMLIKNFITEFDENFNVIRNIQSDEIDISNENWIIYDAKIYKKNNYVIQKKLELKTNFNLQRIKTLYSNLSSLNLIKLYELRKNYKKLNYSIIDIDLHLFKILLFPLFLFLIALFSSLIMLNIKEIKSTTFKISTGLFLSVIIYYLNNFSYVLGSTEKIPIFISVISPLIVLTFINLMMLNNINEK